MENAPEDTELATAYKNSIIKEEKILNTINDIKQFPSFNSLTKELERKLSSKIDKSKIIVECYPYFNDEANKFILKIYYFPNTVYNPYKFDTVIFYIELNEKYPERPKITCHSNVNI